MKALPNKLLVGGNLKRAIVYHGSYSGPKAMVRYVKNGFDAKGAGGLYGYGLYTVFELEGTPTGKGGYGPYVYEFSVDVSRFISFDPKVTRRLFGADLSLEEQVRRVGAHELSPDAYARIREAGVDAAPSSLPFSGSEMALAWWREMEAAPRRAKLPDGILFGGRQDGPVAVLYNMEQARLTRWRTVGTKSVPVFQRGLGRGDGPIGGAISGHWLSPEDAASVGAEFVRVRRLPRMTGVVSARAGVPSGSFEHTPVVRAMTPAQSVYKTRQYHKPVSLQSLIPQASVYGVVRWVLVDGEEEEGSPRILRSEVIIIPTMTPRWGRLTAVQQNEKLAQTLRVVEERRAVLFVSGLDFPQDRQTYVVRGLADVRELLAGPPLAERDDVVYGSPSLRGIWSVSSAGSFSFLQPSVSMREICLMSPPTPAFLRVRAPGEWGRIVLGPVPRNIKFVQVLSRPGEIRGWFYLPKQFEAPAGNVVSWQFQKSDLAQSSLVYEFMVPGQLQSESGAVYKGPLSCELSFDSNFVGRSSRVLAKFTY